MTLFLKLPLECRSIVAKFLDAQSLRRLGLASKDLNNFIKDDEHLWRKVYERSTIPWISCEDISIMPQIESSVPAAQLDRLQEQYELPFFNHPCRWYRRALVLALFLRKWTVRTGLRTKMQPVCVPSDVSVLYRHVLDSLKIFSDRWRVISHIPNGPLTLVEHKLGALPITLCSSLIVEPQDYAFSSSEHYIVVFIYDRQGFSIPISDHGFLDGPRFHDQSSFDQYTDAYLLVVWNGQAPYQHLWTVKTFWENRDDPLETDSIAISGHHLLAQCYGDLRLLDIRTGFWKREISVGHAAERICSWSSFGEFGVLIGGPFPQFLLIDAGDDKFGAVHAQGRPLTSPEYGKIYSLLDTESLAVLFQTTADPPQTRTLATCICKTARQILWASDGAEIPKELDADAYLAFEGLEQPRPCSSGHFIFIPGITYHDHAGRVRVLDTRHGTTVQVLLFPIVIIKPREVYLECPIFSMTVVEDAYLFIASQTLVRMYLICDKGLRYIDILDVSSSHHFREELFLRGFSATHDRIQMWYQDLESLCGFTYVEYTNPLCPNRSLDGAVVG